MRGKNLMYCGTLIWCRAVLFDINWEKQMINEKPKKKRENSRFWKLAVPLWLFSGVVIVLFTLLWFASNQKPIMQLISVTASPAYYGASNSEYTFISALGSPTPPDAESTAEVEVSTNTIMCQDLERAQNGQFAFRMFLQSGMDLFRIDEDGTNFCRLTDNTGNDDYPAWSPDGLKIAYVSIDGEYGLYLMDADGSNVELLHTGGTAYSYPSWSPDGNYVVFQATFNEVFDIYRLELHTGDLINLTNQERLDSMPSYSSDGQFIVFTSDRTFNPYIETNKASQYNNYEIYMMNSDGTNPRRLTVNDFNDAYPSFSPDGTQIIYTGRDIRIMNRDGSHLRQLLNNYGSETIWLPDGRIAYESAGIHTVLPDGTENKLITDKIPQFGSGIAHIDYTPPRS